MKKLIFRTALLCGVAAFAALNFTACKGKKTENSSTTNSLPSNASMAENTSGNLNGSSQEANSTGSKAQQGQNGTTGGSNSKGNDVVIDIGELDFSSTKQNGGGQTSSGKPNNTSSSKPSSSSNSPSNSSSAKNDGWTGYYIIKSKNK